MIPCVDCFGTHLRARRRGLSSYYSQGFASYYGSEYAPLPMRGLGKFPAIPHMHTGTRRFFPRRRGLGDQPLLTTTPEPIEMVPFLDPSVVAAKVQVGQPLTAQETALWKGLTPTARGVYTTLPANMAYEAASPATATAGVGSSLTGWMNSSTTLFGTVIKNSYLAAGGGLAFFALIAMAKKKRGH